MWRMTVGTSLQGKGKWLVVCQHMKLTSFQEVAKMLYSQIRLQVTPIKCAVLGLYRLHLLGKKEIGCHELLT